MIQMINLHYDVPNKTIWSMSTVWYFQQNGAS